MMETVSQNRCFGGVQGVYRHTSKSCAGEMTFGLFIPEGASKTHKVPLLWYLSGLTCTHENAMTKAGLQAHAARHGLAVIFPDTSPRGEGVADDEAYDLGQGAGFYVNATQAPWAAHFQMYTYVLEELRNLVLAEFPLADRHGITGHSMGGHGALTLALGNPDAFDALSAFAPIANPSASDWGRKQLTAYLGADEATWRGHDATLLLLDHGWKSDMLIDQGTADQFIDLLRPEALSAAIGQRRQQATFRMQAGYDHSYFFVASYAQSHVAWHAERLGGHTR